MHRLVPHFILQEYAAARSRGSFPAVGMFVDISGFSTLTDVLMEHGQHGAEVLAELMRRVFEPCIDGVHAQAGFICNFAGDAFTALFPLDDPAGDIPLRALAAAGQMQAHIARLSAYATVYGTFRISAKVGLALGEVAWGIPTSTDGQHASFYFQGTAVDGSAAAEHQAAAGEIILDAALCARLGNRAQVEPAGEHFRLLSASRAPVPIVPPEVPQANLADQVFFFPSDLVTQAFSGEFRQVVNLFISLPTVRSETQLDIFMRSLFDLLEQYGGLLNKLDFGDKGANLLLFWGAPRAHENDVERALVFILDLQSRTSIPINAGVTYQIAHAGFVGSAQREEYTCYGRGVNLAARFMTAAARGEIWLDEGAARRAGARFDLEPMGAQTFKGFAQPQKAYLLLEHKEAGDDFFQGQLVGRTEELRQLAEFVQPVFSGQFAGALVVWGEPGIGKSRLIDAFRRSPTFARDNIQWAQCQTDEILRLPLNPFRYWLRTYFGFFAAQAEGRNKRSFNRKLDDLIAAADEALAAELDRTRSCLGALLDLYWPDSLYEQLDAKGRYENTFTALITLLKAECRRQPLVLLIEDVHWLDDDSKGFLPGLARALEADPGAAYPLALLATARPEDSGLVLEGVLAGKSIHLGGLSPAGLASLAEELLGGPAAPALLDLLAKRSEGNPFFAEQTLRYLKEEGLLEQSAGNWDVRAAGLRPGSLPGDVRAVLVARLDRLSQAVREVVQTASVLGREFEVRLLASMLRDDADLPEKVNGAEQAAIWAALSQLRYLFKHAMLRDAAYSMQLRARRRQLHALALQALEVMYQADLAPYYGELAYHGEQAGLADKAGHYLRLAGDVSLNAYQNQQALQYYTRALALMDPADLKGRYSLLLAREAVYDLQGNRQAQAQDLQALADVLAMAGEAAANPDQQAEVAVRQASYTLNTGDYPRAAALAEEAVRLAELAQAPATSAQAFNLLAEAFVRQGQYAAARQHAETAIGLARQAGDRLSEFRGLFLLGWCAAELAELAAARDYFEQALQTARQIGARREECDAYKSLGNVAGSSGDFSGSWDYGQKSLAIAREIGDRKLESTALYNLGDMAIVLDDLAAARACTGQALVIFREIGHRRGEAYAHVNLGRMQKIVGELVGAQSSLEKALQLTRSLGDKHEEAIGLIQLGQVSLLQGDRAAARLLYEQGLALTRQTGDRVTESGALALLGDIQLDQGDSGAAATYQGALEIRLALNVPYLVVGALAGLSCAALAQGDVPASLGYARQVLDHLDGGLRLNPEEDLWAYLICCRALAAGGDPRAGELLETAYQRLQARAAQLTDPAVRRSFLENVPSNRAIAALYQAKHSQQDR